MKDKPTTAAIVELGFYRFSSDDHLPVTLAWQESSHGAHLLEDEVHLWFVDLDRFEEPLEIIRETLAADEQARASRFRFDTDRRRFVVRRGILRRVLASYLDRSPATLQFAYNSYGKPRLKNGNGIQFNLSVSAELALWGFIRGRSIGVDLEKIHPAFAWEEIANTFFHPAEAERIRRLPPAAQPRAFSRQWTVHEALVKAQGVGLAHASQVDSRSLVGARYGTGWSCVSFQPSHDSVASLVLQP